jgi:hypothetical protein
MESIQRAEPMPDPVTQPAAPVNGAPAAEPWLARAERILSGDIRPDDYLPVTPEVARAAGFEMSFARSHRGEPAPEVEGRQLRQALLGFHHGGEDLATLDTDAGVIVLAVGHPQIRELWTVVPRGDRFCITIETPDLW